MSNDPIVKEELEYRKGNLYDWIQHKVISKCTEPAHIEPCGELINFFEKKGGDPYQVNSLRVSLQMKEAELKGKKSVEESASVEDQVMRLYVNGSHTIKAIAKALGISIFKVGGIIDGNLKNKKQ